MQKNHYRLLFVLLILGVVILACGGSDTASNVSKTATVSQSEQAISTPIPNTPDLELSFVDIIQNPDEKNWTRTQYSTYLDTIKGRHISGWSGTILEIEEFAGKPYLSLDMESGEPEIDAYVYISEEDVPKVSLRQKVTFEGTIDDTWPEANGFYALQIEDVTLLELGEIPTPEPGIDDLTNQKIQSLICDEEVFIQRLADTSSFIDLEQSSYPEKRVVFKDGYVETEYFAYKKLLEASARFLRDFPCLGGIQVVINHDGQKYIADVELNDFEEFLGVDFEQLQEDIDKWRTFLEMIDKPLVQNFAEKYVTQESPTNITDTAVELEKYVQAGDSNINLRSGPGTDYEVVGVLASGGSLEVVGRNADSSWWQVSAPEGLVWVAARVVIANNIDDSIPVVESPPPPILTESPQPAGEPATTEQTPVAACDCSGNLYNCPDFGTYSSAQTCYEYCISIGRGDVHGLDRDGDGTACDPSNW